MNKILLIFLLLLCVHYSNAQITPSPAIMCGGNPVTISVPTGATTYQWQSSAAQPGPYSNITGAISASYSATSAGWYQVIVNGTPSNPVQVINSPLPVPSFTYDNNNTCAGTAIHFTSLVSNGNPGYTYAWNFGDAGTSTLQNPTHVYAILGCATVNYTVTLTVTDAYGCTNTVSNSIQVKPKPDVQIADDDIFSPFSNCDHNPTAANPNFTLSVHNSSPSAACITTYSIDWGDGNTQAGISFPISHTYTILGAFPLTVTATSSNGCVNTKTYTVANQSNPAGGLGTLGSTTGLCAPATVPFIISNWENNSPGTSYLLDFGDGTTMTLSHPLNGTSTPQTINHTYTTSSCPQPTFTATLKVYNACDTTPYTAGNIQVRIKPTADFNIVPTPGCVNQSVCFTNTTVAGTTGPTCSAATAYSWDFGDPSSGTNTSTATSPCHIYTTPGTYTITLQATNPCGTSTITKTVCINAPLVPLFTIDNNLGCIPLTVNTTNNTDNSLNCSPATYAWTVTYAAGNCGVSSSYVFTGGTTATSLNPSFIFSNPGIYTITLSVTNSCGTVTTSKTVTIKKPPTVSIPVLPNICGASSVTPTATVVNCGTGVLSYSWSFPGGSPSTSTSASPGTITYSTSGSYTISLAVTNECGTTNATQSLTVGPVPDFTAPANVSVCPGASVGSFAFTSNPAGAVFTWTNSNTAIGLAAGGSGTIPVFTATNITAAPITGTITVTATLNGCTKVNTFTITVNPNPALPIVTSPVTYCVGAPALPLSATALPGNALHWYTTAVGGVELGSAPTPSTVAPGTTTWYVSQSSPVGNCEGNRASITVTVNPIPVINFTATNPATCGGTGSFTITGLIPNIAYTGSYINTLGVTVPINATSSATGTITISGLIAGTYTNISVTLNSCQSNILPSITLTSPSQPAAPTAGNNSPMCSGGTLTLNASTVAGGTYQWNGPAGFNSTSQNPTILNVTTAATGTYTVTVSVAGCVSLPATTNVTIDQTPSVPVITSNSPVCTGNTITLNATSTVGADFSWTGPGGYTSNIANPTIPNAQTTDAGTYIVTATLGTCTSTASTNIIVNPTPVISATSQNPTTCGGTDGQIIINVNPNGTYLISYIKNAVTITNSYTSVAGVITIGGLSAGTYSGFNVSLSNCPANLIGPFSLIDPSAPAAPTAGSNSPVCSGNTISLNAFSVTPGVSYLWSGPGGYSSNAQNPNIINSTVAMTGSYSVTVSLNGCTSSPASTPVVVNQTPVLTSVTSNSPVCSGNTLNLNVATSTPGAMTYAWSGPSGFGSTNQNPSIPNVTIAANGIYSVVVTATTGNCPSAPGTTNVVINATPVILSGSVTDPNACGSATGSIDLNGLLPSTNYTINYTSSSGPQTLTATSNASGIVTIAGLSAGTYNNFTVTLLGCVSTPAGPFTLNDPNPPAAPTVTSNSPLCAGATLLLNASSPAAGIISYQWTGPNSFSSNLQNPSITNVAAANAGTYFATVTVNSCPSPPASVLVTINAQGALPSVISPVIYCIGSPANPLTATANGGNTLNWYNTPAGGVPLGAAPVPSTATAGSTFYYVSQTTSFGCEGARAPIEVKVNPDARAVFIPTDTIKCAPFQLTAAVIGLQLFPANNSNYFWYANNVLIGSGSAFPGYTINNQDDSVYIKLVAVSAFGCKDDSSIIKFKTYKVPVPSFTQSLAGGCGPVTVLFTNTTPDISDYTYYWDFGDGQTSNLQQPGPIVFLSSPTYNDTFYIVKLKVFSICDTITYSDTVFVNSKPKPLFTPNNVNGCSPMHVTFTNTSLGTGNSYLWIFDDGQTYATNSTNPVFHTFNTGVIDTFHVKLIVTNGCGSDSITYLIIAAPNSIHLNFSFNGTSQYGCAPHSMAFFNNSTGGGSFVWNFGDGNTITTTNNIDTVPHTFNLPGVYTVSVTALNNCTDTTATKTITVYAKPIPAFTASTYNGCIGQQIQFTNGSTGSSSVQWEFGDGTFSSVFSPIHTYSTPGLYTVTMVTYNSNPSGNVCSDSITHQVQVNATQAGNITLSANSSPCAPFTVIFDNLDIPAVSTTWDFGDGQTGTGNHVVHIYAVSGTYQVHVIVTAPGGCTYITDRTVTVGGPAGSLQYNSGNVCYPASTLLQATATNADSYFWQFGDGNTQTTTTPTIFHQYQNPGTYTPSVTLQSNAGCSILLTGTAPIKVDKVIGGYRYSQSSNCGATTLSFTDTSHAFFGVSQVHWDFGDTQTGTGATISHTFLITGTYNVQMIVIGSSGCTDTVTKPIYVFVKSKPTAVIAGPAIKCGLENVSFTANIVSTDPVTLSDWLLSNGATASGTTFIYNFTLPGTYTLRFIAGTSNGCFDTAFHTIQIKPVPTVVASGGVTLCSGNTANLSVSGATTYQWTPIQGLSCNTCTNPVATPVVTTPYVVGGTTNGCTGYDTVIVTVIPPIHMTVSPNDSICIGQTALLQASGAATYIWNPAATLSSATDPNPIATPTSSTIYRVIGADGHNCFSDTAYITIGVGPYPIISLGPDLVLAAGTQQPLIATVQNGPLTQWLWTPSTNLNCNTCPQPIANIKKEITYILVGTTAYGCSSSDTINIKVFCAESQVFIPNAFTPDGDGLNDILMVYGKGIVTVKHFRIFNRWGELVFERDNFSPNNPAYGWNGNVKGKPATPDVFVYTAEVMCENGTTFTYKGNISIIK